jgi:hypothetical protein
MATRLRRSFIAKMSSMLLIWKSFFQLSDQRVPQVGASASVKHRSETTSCRSVQVSLLGPAHQDRLGKIGKFPRVRMCLCIFALSVLGLSSANAQQLGINDAMDAYRTVDGWVRDLGLPEQVDDSLPALSMASVTLRLDGQVIGRGQIVSSSPAESTLPHAARKAIAQANAWVRNRVDIEPSDEVWDSVATRMTLSLELADQVVPMNKDALAQHALGLSSGVQALIMRLGEQAEVVTPDEMFSLGFTLEQAAYSMATELSGDGAMSLASIGELLSRGYTFARCQPIWIAQSAEGRGGVFVDRGGRVIEESAVGLKSVRAMADQLAEHLIAQQWPGSEQYGLVGQRDVISGRSNPEVAPIYEQALVAQALIRYADDMNDPKKLRARENAMDLLSAIAEVQPGEPAPWDDQIGSAACLIAFSEFDLGLRPNTFDELQKRCTKTLNGIYSPIDGFSNTLPPAAQGLVAYAMVRTGHQHAQHAVKAVFQNTQPGELVAQMPFLGWAELELAQKSESIPASEALNQMRTFVWGHQLGKSDLDWKDRDYIGSVVFTKGTNRLPGSENIRPIAFLCSMLGDARLTPGTIADFEVASEIGRVASSMRFVNQLMMDDSSSFLSRAPERSVGGVRQSLTDWRTSPVSSALALMAAIEFEDSVRAIGARKRPESSP